MKTIAAICALATLVFASACSGIAPDDAGSIAADAGSVSVAPTYAIGDACSCCVAGPDGETFCVQGTVTILEGLMCLAIADASAPAWVPQRYGCLLP